MIINKKSTSSDLEFIERKVKEGNWISVSGAIDNINDVIEYTVPNGKTFYFYEAHVNITGHVSPTVSTYQNAVQADLLIDSVVKDKIDTGFMGYGQLNAQANGWAYMSSNVIKSESFQCLGLSLVGNGSKKVQIKNVLDNGSAYAKFSGWLSDT